MTVIQVAVVTPGWHKSLSRKRQESQAKCLRGGMSAAGDVSQAGTRAQEYAIVGGVNDTDM